MIVSFFKMNINNFFSKHTGKEIGDDFDGLSIQGRPYLLWGLILCLLVVFFVRYYYGRDIPLSGDEVGVGVLQSVGNWSSYKNTLPLNEKTDIGSLRKYIEYTDEKSASDVVSTMRTDKLHPPLYFIILHFVIKYFGTTVAVLRTLSILFSIFSLITIYFLGKALFNQSVGLLSAAFMALSAYCLEYSVMVRLYPLAMWLSLLSTLLVVVLVKTKSFHYRSFLLYIYILVSVAGLYTYYSFAVLIASQFVFVFLSVKKDVKTVVTIFSTYALIIVLLVPWILPMIEGVNSVQTKDYYFKGSYTLVVLIKYFYEIIFIPFKNQLGSFNAYAVQAGILTLGLLIASIYLFSIYKSARKRTTMFFLFSVFLYFSIFIVSDKLLDTKMMLFNRQHYFAVPVLLLFLASAVVHLSKNRYLKRLVLLLLVILFISGFVYRYLHKSVFDGPYYFQQLAQQLDKYTANASDKGNLILYNAKDKRYLLPFVYHTTRNFDLIIIPGGINDTILSKIEPSSKYRNIMLVNIDVPAVKRERLKLQSIDVDKVTSYLNIYGYKDDVKPYIYTNEETLTINYFSR